MESLNMNTLASSLPNSVNAEKQLMDNFKAAALSITTLYRSSLDTSKRAYTAGYATCLLDVLHFVEAGVSVSQNEGEEMTIGRVMDWLEARLEAIKSTEEEEEEDRMKEGPAKAVPEETPKEEKRSHKLNASPAVISRLHRSSKENLHETVQPASSALNHPPSLSPPAPVPRAITSPSPPPPAARAIKQKRGLKELNPITPLSTDVGPFPVALTQNTSFPPFTFSPDVISTVPAPGSKRRHATMISESHTSSSPGTSSSPNQAGGHIHVHGVGRRKRARNARDRDLYHSANANGNGPQGPAYTDAMEIEEECGRERKRPARR